MPMGAGPTSPTEDRRASPPMVGPPMAPFQSAPMVVSDSYAKDAVISWFKGEFAAANAIIDALSSHLSKLSSNSGGSKYDSLFAAMHKRRANWIPVIQMQKFYSIADITVELTRIGVDGGGDRKEMEDVYGQKDQNDVKKCLDEKDKADEKSTIGAEETTQEDDSPDSEITDSDTTLMISFAARKCSCKKNNCAQGSHDKLANSPNIKLCSNHEACGERISKIILTKGFYAKESIKGHWVNVVKGLKLYEDVFTDAELDKLTNFVNELHAAGQKGELSGETFILFNKQMKGNKREMIQLGVPIFGPIKEEAKANIDPIPALLQGVIDHLIQWQLIPEYKRPNGCNINFFLEDEYSQPFLKPPHLDQPVSTLLLSEATMAYGRTLMCCNDGNYKAPLKLPLKKGSLLVMRGNSTDMARHVICPTPTRRICITFFRVRPDSNQCLSPTSPVADVVDDWQPSVPSPYVMTNGAPTGYEGVDMMPKWGIIRAPMVMLAPIRPVFVSPQKLPPGGTGVFLPWNVPSAKKPAKHLPPRVIKERLFAVSSPVDAHAAESTSTTSTSSME